MFRKLSDLDVRGKRVFVRVDFNVPLKETAGGDWEVADAARIEGAMPTIHWLLEHGARVILASHLGRPKGKPSKKYSLEPVGRHLAALLKKEVLLPEDCVGDGPRSLSQQMRPGDVMLLENLRFHPGEEENAAEFAHQLLALTDVFVGDAFGTLHRAHASTDALPRLVKDRAPGLLVDRELEFLYPLRDHPKRPFALLMGGSKVSDKIGVLEHFLSKVDKVLIGGAMAYAFLKAKGYRIGRSLCADDQVKLAEKLLKAADARGVELLLPVDHWTVTAFNAPASRELAPTEDVPENRMAIDIGPKTVELFVAALAKVETLFWNGPLGAFEVPEYAVGTTAVATRVATMSAKKMAGGGDVAAAIAGAGVAAKFDFISTGGGATLEFLEGKALPGLDALAVSPGAD
jgi:phosphoglycerate kinase